MHRHRNSELCEVYDVQEIGSKSRSTDAIDYLVGVTMALGRASAGEPSISIYSTDEHPEGLRYVLGASLGPTAEPPRLLSVWST